ncbi:hypothetical protein ColLi_04932 [Colletotrichum liriopes]|uniref:Uncharacterized protein n=1 Tax=Colletotrichum liriopes TaxID=708192 RepID=A0AA37GJD7_9PEZI|nr:hypothetical protein ColLi_04932 [Colletotrichum liriopes]
MLASYEKLKSIDAAQSFVNFASIHQRLAGCNTLDDMPKLQDRVIEGLHVFSSSAFLHYVQAPSGNLFVKGL